MSSSEHLLLLGCQDLRPQAPGPPECWRPNKVGQQLMQQLPRLSDLSWPQRTLTADTDIMQSKIYWYLCMVCMLR